MCIKSDVILNPAPSTYALFRFIKSNLKKNGLPHFLTETLTQDYAT